MPKNEHFIIQDYLKLFRRIQCYRVFVRIIVRQYYLKLCKIIFFLFYCFLSLKIINLLHIVQFFISWRNLQLFTQHL